MRNSIRAKLTILFLALAVGPLLLVGIVLAWQSYVSEQGQALALQNERAQRISTQVLSYMEIQENALTELIEVQGLDQLGHEEQTELLTSLVAFSNALNTLSLIGADGQEEIVISSTEVTLQMRNVSGSSEFAIPAATREVYYGPVQFSKKTGEPYLVIAAPITDVRSGAVTDVLAAEVRLKPVWDLLANLSLEDGGNAYIVDAANRVVAHNNPSVVLRNTLFTVPDQEGVHTGLSGSNVVLTTDPLALGEQRFTVVTETPVREALATLINTEITIAVLLLVATTIAGALGWLAARQIVQPIEALAVTAQAVSQGDLTKRAEVTQRDEIGNLAAAFNHMTSQLRDLIANLEDRVAARTRALTTVAEVGTAASTILDSDELLQKVVDLSKERFGFYHAHIYLLDAAGDTLVLACGAGDVGRQMVAKGHAIPVHREQSLVARAMRERQGVTVNDVTQTPDFLPNPLLPDTRAELAVPMMIGDRVIGVFDVQSDLIGRFTDADIAVQTTLAAQIASSVQASRLYAEAEIARQEAQSLVDYAVEGIAILDLETERWAEPNENFARIFGMTREEMAATGPKVMSPPRQPDGRPSVEKAIEMINTAMEKGSHRFEWVHLTKEGTPFDCEIGLVRLPGDRPRLRQSLSDITERKRLEQMNIQRARHQEALNRITQKIQSTTRIETALQIAARELGVALGRRQTLVSLDLESLTGTAKAVDNE